MKNLKKENILRVRICSSAKKDILTMVKKRLDTKSQTVIFTPNPQIILNAQKSKAMIRRLNESTINLPDGIGLVLASKILRGNISSRIGGIDFAQSLLNISAKRGYTVFLLGAKPSVAKKAAQELKKKYPSLRICGTHHGYFSSKAEKKSLIAKIKAASPDILFVCLGSPMQEKWISKNKVLLPSVKLFIGLGGSLDVWAGCVKRAPTLIQEIGLEWLYRTVKEPRRARIFLDIPIFIFKIFKHKKRLSQKFVTTSLYLF